jgi:hypothetical protein
MKYLISGALAFLTIVTLSNCDKEETGVRPSNFESFTFGTHFCFCTGTCAILYEISEEALRAGEGTGCLPQDYTFDGVVLTQDKYAIAKQLIDEFPDKLIQDSQDTYGCPDCADQGAYYLQMRNQGETRTWRLDTFTEDLPAWLRSYQQSVQEVLEALQ